MEGCKNSSTWISPTVSRAIFYTYISGLLPLTIDHAMEAREFSVSNSLLFRKTSLKILRRILLYIATDRRALSSLALVNSDCLQLVRSYRYRFVDISGQLKAYASSVVRDLRREAQERSEAGETCALSVRAYVHRVLLGLTAISLNDSVASFDSYNAPGLYPHGRHDRPFPHRALVFSALPRLESLGLRWSIPGHPPIVGLFASPTIRDFRFSGRAGILPLMLRCADLVVWQPTHLTLLLMFPEADLDPTRDWEDFFRTCASTLTVLKLATHVAPTNSSTETISFNLNFPRLRLLNLTAMTPSTAISGSALRSLLTASQLTALAVTYADEHLREFLDQVGRLPSLKSVIFQDATPISDMLRFRFLEDNTHITGFAVEWPQPRTIFRRVMEILATMPNLESLSMTCELGSWESDYTMFSNLTSLECLSISICTVGDDEVVTLWEADHNIIRPVLLPLQNLRQLMFSFDVYAGNTSRADYYKYVTPKLHCAKMLGIMRDYIVALPKLEFIYVGRVSLHVDDSLREMLREGRQHAFFQIGMQHLEVKLEETLLTDYYMFGRYGFW
ncbi:hypothetical protein F4779DRAFT_87087 [Xylariaceae sp. FL0662B]|nr:hypothetical protein F4779DRAFT_87087 [Xylariaceae sp. FL0662B]